VTDADPGEYIVRATVDFEGLAGLATRCLERRVRVFDAPVCPDDITGTWTIFAAGSRTRFGFCGPVPPSSCTAPSLCDNPGCLSYDVGTAVTFHPGGTSTEVTYGRGEFLRERDLDYVFTRGNCSTQETKAGTSIRITSSLRFDAERGAYVMTRGSARTRAYFEKPVE